MRIKGSYLALGIAVSLTSGYSIARADAPHWSYYGETGPNHWGELSAEFATCKSGQAQSPVNIGRQTIGMLPPLQVHYRSSPIFVVNTGHSIKIEVPQGSHLTVDGKDYELKQFHFHTPSEHASSGRQLAMEIHFVHESRDGELAILAVLARTTYRPHPTLNRIWEFLPHQAGETNIPARLRINPVSLIPANRDYATYLGSLTTPPCTEGVRWFVLQTPLRVSRAQVEKLALGIIGDNARPVQPLNGRTITANR